MKMAIARLMLAFVTGSGIAAMAFLVGHQQGDRKGYLRGLTEARAVVQGALRNPLTPEERLRTMRGRLRLQDPPLCPDGQQRDIVMNSPTVTFTHCDGSPHIVAGPHGVYFYAPGERKVGINGAQ